MLKWLLLDYEAKAREGVVLSQALSAIVAASLDVLGRKIDVALLYKHFASREVGEHDLPHAEKTPTAAAATAATLLAREGLLAGWEEHRDEASGKAYFHSPATGETTWDRPSAPEPSPPPPPLPAEGAGAAPLLTDVDGSKAAAAAIFAGSAVKALAADAAAVEMRRLGWAGLLVHSACLLSTVSRRLKQDLQEALLLS